MIDIKNLKLNKKTALLTIYSESGLLNNSIDEKRIIALSLMIGNFNPLRKYASSGVPIDLDKFEKYQDRFNTLIDDIVSDLEIDEKVS